MPQGTEVTVYSSPTRTPSGDRLNFGMGLDSNGLRKLQGCRMHVLLAAVMHLWYNVISWSEAEADDLREHQRASL